MIRAVFVSMLMLFAAAFSASAQEVLEPNPEIEATISSQFNAFRADDVIDAWQYASPNIQGIFGDPQNFGRMVEEAFPMVWAPGAVTFIDLQTFGAVIVQRVEVVDQGGNVHYLGYAMIETDDGWRINGVQILEAPTLAA